MQRHGTTPNKARDTFASFSEAVLRSLPRDLGPDVEASWANNEVALARTLRGALAPSQNTAEAPVSAQRQAIVPVRLTPPKVDEEFILEYDFDTVDPIGGMVREVSLNPDFWGFKGTRLSGIQKRRFKLISVWHSGGLENLRRAILYRGHIPEGQWIAAFKSAYPDCDACDSLHLRETMDTNNQPIGILDASWVSRGIDHFPMLCAGMGFKWQLQFAPLGSTPDLHRFRWLTACV